MTIRNIRLKNFQGHADTELELSPGINVIAGESASGKSSILRGLWWLIHNRPAGAGEKFKHRGSADRAEVSVAVTLDNGSITRYRKHTDNGYVVNGEVLKAIRQDVPTEVSSILNLQDYNFQRQHRSPTVPGSSPVFLLEDGPAQVAKRLNEICGLEIIDESQRAANAIALRLGQDTRTTNDNLQRLTQDLKGFDHLDDMETAVTGLETRAQQRRETTQQADNLNALRKLLAESERGLKRIDTFMAVETDPVAVAVFAKINQATVTRGGVETLRTLRNELARYDRDMQRYNKLAEAESGVTKLLALIGEKEDVTNRVRQLCTLVESIRRLDRDIQSKDGELKNTEEEFHQLLEAEGVCPLCEQRIGK